MFKLVPSKILLRTSDSSLLKSVSLNSFLGQNRDAKAPFCLMVPDLTPSVKQDPVCHLDIFLLCSASPQRLILKAPLILILPCINRGDGKEGKQSLGVETLK